MSHHALEQLQAAFCDYLYSGANASTLARSIASPKRIAAETRLDVYRNAYYLRLQEALAHDFPALRALLGDAAFGPMMADYIRACPSTSPSLRDLGARLTAYLAQRKTHLLAELSALEWAIVQAFDAADADTPDAGALTTLAPEAWQDLRFALHPSATRLQLTSNALAVWMAYRNRQPVPALVANAPEAVIVWRRSGVPCVRPLTSPLASFLAGIAQGHRFATICEQMQSLVPPDQLPRVAAQCLGESLVNQWITPCPEPPCPQPPEASGELVAKRRETATQAAP